MGTYTLRVVRADDHDVTADSAVSERVLAAVDSLFGEICRNIVSGELRLQGEVPEDLYADVRVLDDRDLAADARRMMDGTLGYLGGGIHGTWMDDTFPDVVGRKRVAARVLDVASALDGCVLVHGVEGEEGVFSGVDTVWVRGMANAVVRATNGGLMGLVVRDPVRRDRWALMRDDGPVPLIFKPGTSRYDIEDYAAAGPVIVTGTVIRDDDDSVVEIRTIENCYTFPGVVFLRGIGAGRDLGLVSALEAVPSYYQRGRRWHLRNQDLGIEAEGDTWDSCVMDFHRRFLDQWHSHSDGTAEVNARIRGMLDAMHPFPREADQASH